MLAKHIRKVASGLAGRQTRNRSFCSKVQNNSSKNGMTYAIFGFVGGAVATTVYARYVSDKKESSIPVSKSKIDEKYLKNWDLYYWPTIGGRGMYVRMLFLLANAEWNEPARSQDGAHDGIHANVVQEFRGSNNPIYPCFAPPIIVHNNGKNKNEKFLLSQTAAIVLYLSKKFGLLPQSEEDLAHGTQIMHQIFDALGEAELAYHPISRNGTYKSQMKEAEPYIEDFLKKRLSSHLSVVEEALKRNGKNGKDGWFFDDKITFVDAVVATFMRGYETSQPQIYNNEKQFQLLKQHRKRFEQIEAIGNYLNDETKRPPIDDNSFMG